MTNEKRGGGLQIIFSFFLGLMVTAFVGVGVYTFHGPPNAEIELQIRELNRQEQALRNAKPDVELTSEDRAKLQEIVDERDELRDAAQALIEPWGRSTAIILIALATLVMAVSLVRADQLPVISNGLLLGGVFTMVYGVGWIVSTDTSVSRFVVMTVALGITLALGYVRFVRRQQVASIPGGQLPADEQSFPDIERRLQKLEERLNEAAVALSPKDDMA